VVGKTAPIRAHDAERMKTISKFCGCLPCLLMGLKDVATTIEHVTERGRRVGQEEQHQHTIGLCEWHHFGVVWEGMTRHGLMKTVGPPLSFGRTVFEETFGDEVQILVPVQDFLLSQFAEDPWPEYNLPRHVMHKTRRHWIELKHAANT
jgi:hypothetical protein